MEKTEDNHQWNNSPNGRTWFPDWKGSLRAESIACIYEIQNTEDQDPEMKKKVTFKVQG